MTKVFISHSHRDAVVAAEIERELEHCGVDVVNPAYEVPRPELSFRNVVEKGIRRADAVIVLIASPEAAGLSWVAYEMGMAEAIGKPVLVLASNSFSPSGLPSDLLAPIVLSFDPRTPKFAVRELVEQLATQDRRCAG